MDLFTGQELPRTSGMGCAGTTPIEAGWKFNPVDSFQNKAYTRGSFGLGWTNAYDVVFLPFSGGQKRMVMPGGRRVNFTGSSGNLSTDHPLFAGALARQLASDTGSAGSTQTRAFCPSAPRRAAPPLCLTAEAPALVQASRYRSASTLATL